jgi:small subunit ribosomal protein S16
MQRVGRKGYAQYRIIVQEAQLSPKSGRVVANIGTYNPHSKEVTVDADKVNHYLGNGAQPSDSVIRILKAQGIKLPKWVTPDATEVKRTTKNPDKLRKNQPKESPAEKETNEAEVKAEPEKTEEETSEVAEETKPDEESADN